MASKWEELYGTVFNPAKLDDSSMYCSGCGKIPSELGEYIGMIKGQEEYYDSPADFVLKEEGTLDRYSGAFCCTNCYVAIGMPSLPPESGGWKAPPGLSDNPLDDPLNELLPEDCDK